MPAVLGGSGMHVSPPGQRKAQHPHAANAQNVKPQVSLIRDRIASGAQAASSTTPCSPTASRLVSSPAQTLLMPLQKSLTNPLAKLEEMYSLSLVAEPPTKPSKEQQDYNLQFGHALRTLRDDIPEFFRQPQRMDIFTDDVVFVDTIGPRLGLGPGTVKGKSRYNRHLWTLRLLATLVFCSCEVDVQRFWQRSEQSVAVRWVMHGRPRLLNAVVGTTVRLDGISEFKFNSKGYIYQHTVDCINWDGLRLGLHEQEMAHMRKRVMRAAGMC